MMIREDQKFTYEEKFQEARRELTKRQGVYSLLIARGQMTKQKAARQIALMEDICRDYERLAQSERLL